MNQIEKVQNCASDNLRLSELHEEKLIEVKALFQEAKDYFDNADADNTKRSYRSDWIHFSNWCEKNNSVSLPVKPETLILYLTELAREFKASTIKRRLSTIARVHKENGFEASLVYNQKVRRTLKGIHNKIGSNQAGKKPLLAEDIKAMVKDLNDTLKDSRDRAILLIGFAGTFRRSELSGLNVEDLNFVTDGVIITLRKSKTDQEGQGIKKGILCGENPKTCPVLALKNWLEISGLESGAVFRSFDIHGNLNENRLSDRGVALIVKRYAKKIGKDEKDFAGHSLRSGSVTQGAINGVNDRALMNQGGWRSRSMVDRYVKDANIFRNNLSGALGL